MDIFTDRALGDMPTRDYYKTYLRSLSDTALRAETVQVVTDADALKMEACRKQWETLGRASVFLECYNKAVKEMKSNE